MTTKIAISVDDVCAKPQYGLFLDYGPLKYLKKLNDKHGAKFTLFFIPNRENNNSFKLNDVGTRTYSNTSNGVR